MSPTRLNLGPLKLIHSKPKTVTLIHLVHLLDGDFPPVYRRRCRRRLYPFLIYYIKLLSSEMAERHRADMSRILSRRPHLSSRRVVHG